MPLRHARLRTPRATLPYLFAVCPSGAEAPLVVFLHGAKDRGEDPAKLLAWGFPKFAGESGPLPYHWLALQIPEGTTWPQWQDELFDLIDVLQPEHRAHRVVLAGFSMGSAGAWQIAAERPDRIAGLVLVSGRKPETIGPESLARLARIPVWIAHGERDDKVPVEGAISAYEALRDLGAAARLDLYPEGDHFIADQAYASADLQAWLADPADRAPLEGKARAPEPRHA
jgi:predicted peptidase